LARVWQTKTGTYLEWGSVLSNLLSPSRQRRRVARAVVVLAVASLPLLLSGCIKESVTRKIESGVRSRLPSMIGPAESYEVKASGQTVKMMSGQVSQLELRGRGVRPLGELYIDDLVVRMRNVKFDVDKSELQSVEESAFEATLLEKSVTQYVAKSHPDLQDLKVEMADGKATVRAKSSLLGISAEMVFTGRLEIASQSKLNFMPDQMSVAGLPMPDALVGLFAERVNPVLDLSTFRFPIALSGVTILPGAVRIEGTADLTHTSKTVNQGAK